MASVRGGAFATPFGVSMKKNIIIKTTEESSFLRDEALVRAINFEENYMKDRKEGARHCVIFSHTISSEKDTVENIFIIYHTKTSIVVEVRIEGTL